MDIHARRERVEEDLIGLARQIQPHSRERQHQKVDRRAADRRDQFGGPALGRQAQGQASEGHRMI